MFSFWGAIFDCLFMNSVTVQGNCSEVTPYKHMTKVSCQTTKWCSHFPFKHSVTVFFCATVQKVCPCVCVCEVHMRIRWLPGVLLTLCIKAWLTSQHTSHSLPAMTSWRHLPAFRRRLSLLRRGLRICIVTCCSKAFHVVVTCHYAMEGMRCCMTTAGQPQSNLISVSHQVERITHQHNE